MSKRVDNPRKNLDICVMTAAGLEYLGEQQIDAIVTKIEKEEEEEQMQQE